MRRTAQVLGSPAMLVFVMLGFAVSAADAQQDQSLVILKTLSLEELGNLTVTSVSKAEEALSGAAAAITVITNEDIRRSGATSLCDWCRGSGVSAPQFTTPFRIRRSAGRTSAPYRTLNPRLAPR